MRKKKAANEAAAKNKISDAPQQNEKKDSDSLENMRQKMRKKKLQKQAKTPEKAEEQKCFEA